MFSKLFPYFLVAIIATFLPYLACDFLSIPFLHGFFCVDIFILLTLLKLPKNKLCFFSWSIILFLFSLIYENNLDQIQIIFLNKNLHNLITFFSFFSILIFSQYFSSRKKNIFFIFFLIVVICSDWLNVFYFGYSISFKELFNIAFHFVWSAFLLITIPILHFGIIYHFSKKILLSKNLKLYESFTLLGIFTTLLIINIVINSLQQRETILNTPIKTFMQKFSTNTTYTTKSKDIILSNEILSRYQIFTHSNSLQIDSSYTSVVMVLVESWGVPKNINLLKYSFSFFDDVPQSFKGLYLRNVAYTQGAEWEDFNMPQGKSSDFTLPKLYQNAHYETWYLHGYDGDFYERKTNYPALGFDSLLFRTELFKRGLKSCKYGYPGICDTSTATFIAEILSDSSKKYFIYWTTLDAHYPYSLSPEEKESDFCKDFNLNEAECAYYSRQSISLKMVASLAKKFPRTRFIVRGDHRPMMANTPGFVSSFYHRWVPMLILN